MIPGRDRARAVAILGLLAAVRERRPDLPFVLFTGKGSEEIASEAISAGVTDYLRKGGPDCYTVLANRVRHAVERRRAERERDRQAEAMEVVEEGVAIFDADANYRLVNRAYAALYGRRIEWFVGRTYEVVNTPVATRDMHETVLPAARERGVWRGVTEGLRSDGTVFPKLKSVTALADGGFVCVVHDVTECPDEWTDGEGNWTGKFGDATGSGTVADPTGDRSGGVGPPADASED